MVLVICQLLWVVFVAFFIESKLFQLVVEEGGRYFSFKDF